VEDKMRSLSLNDRGQVSGMVSQVLSIVVLVIVLVMGLIIVQEIRDTDLLITGDAGCNATVTSACTAYNAANDSLVGLGTVSDFIPIVVLAIIASVVIALILVGFAFRRNR
jgi:uncharacterized protein (UPF0333 family)